MPQGHPLGSTSLWGGAYYLAPEVSPKQKGQEGFNSFPTVLLLNIQPCNTLVNNMGALKNHRGPLLSGVSQGCPKHK